MLGADGYKIIVDYNKNTRDIDRINVVKYINNVQTAVDSITKNVANVTSLETIFFPPKEIASDRTPPTPLQVERQAAKGFRWQPDKVIYTIELTRSMFHIKTRSRLRHLATPSLFRVGSKMKKQTSLKFNIVMKNVIWAIFFIFLALLFMTTNKNNSHNRPHFDTDISPLITKVNALNAINTSELKLPLQQTGVIGFVKKKHSPATAKAKTVVEIYLKRQLTYNEKIAVVNILNTIIDRYKQIEVVEEFASEIGAVAFAENSYSGESIKLEPGRYSSDQLPIDIKSIKVFPNHSVTFYREPNFRPPKFQTTTDVSDLGAGDMHISGFIVENSY